MPVVLITGACGGIGRALCDRFAEAGYSVIGVDRRNEKGFPHALVHFDISCLAHEKANGTSFVEQIDSLSGGRLDTLINNAAIQIVKPFTDLTHADWTETLDTNLLAPFWLSRRFYQQLKSGKGSIINISSIHAKLTKRHFTAYATSKGALVTLTKALALELAPEIRVNAILPAATATPMLQAGFIENPAGMAVLESYHPLACIANPRQIADTALFLAGPQASFMTGAALDLDGGIGNCLHDPGTTTGGHHG